MRQRVFLTFAVLAMLLSGDMAPARGLFARRHCPVPCPCPKYEWYLYTCENGNWVYQLAGPDLHGLFDAGQSILNAAYAAPPEFKWCACGVCYSPLHVPLPPPPPGGPSRGVFTITCGPQLHCCKCCPAPAGACQVSTCRSVCRPSPYRDNNTDYYVYYCQDGLNYSVCIHGPTYSVVKAYADRYCCAGHPPGYCEGPIQDGGLLEGTRCGDRRCSPCASVITGR